uniref:Integrin-like protein n=2 Tax=Oikopleura dioica TaxID=34765 RepID=Q8WPN1_OIKDI|nr:integrin-like protein [Oikopleura dioica]
MAQAESGLKQMEKEIMPTDTEVYNEMICLQVCAKAVVINKKYAQQYTKKSVDERIKNVIRITSVLEVANTKRLIRIAASMLWNQLLPLLEPQLKLNELDKYVIGALNMIVSHDPMNENAYKCCRELSRLALSKENLTAASRHLIHSVSLCNDEKMKHKMHQEARMISAAVNPYNRPENQLEQAGKLVQEASIAPVNKINPILVQTGRLLSSEFMEKYNAQKKLQPFVIDKEVNYDAALEIIPTTVKYDDELTVAEIWFKAMKMARKYNRWHMLRTMGRQIAFFREGLRRPDEAELDYIEQRSTNLSTAGSIRPSAGAAGKKTSLKPEPSKMLTRQALSSAKVACTAEESEALFSESDLAIGRICCESMLLEAEAWVQLLRSEGSDIFAPNPAHESVEIQEIQLNISEFICSLMKDCLDLASELEYTYMVHNAAVYLWNYAQKLRVTGQLKYIEKMMMPIYKVFLKQPSLEPNLLVRTATVLSLTPPPAAAEAPPLSSNNSLGDMSNKSESSKGSSKRKTKIEKIDSESPLAKHLVHLQNALQISEKAIEATRSFSLDAKSLLELTRNWLKLRLEIAEINKEQINASILKIGSQPSLKQENLLVYVWLNLDLHYASQSSCAISLADLAELIDKTRNEDLQLSGHIPFIIMAYRFLATMCLSGAQELIPLSRQSCEASLDLFSKLSGNDREMCSREVAFCHLLLGQVIENEEGDLEQIQREFVFAAELSEDLALAAANLWWNASRRLANEIKGRAMLATQAKQLINAISKKPRDKGNAEVRARLYWIVVKSYMDKENYSAALRELDTVIQSMPKIPQRQVLHLTRLECKAQLDMDPMNDINRIGGDEDEFISANWRHYSQSQIKLEKEIPALASLNNAIKHARSLRVEAHIAELLLERATIEERNEKYIDSFKTLTQARGSDETSIRAYASMAKLSQFKSVNLEMEKQNLNEEKLLKLAKRSIQELNKEEQREIISPEPIPSTTQNKKKSKKEDATPPPKSPQFELIKNVELQEICNVRSFCKALFFLYTKYTENGMLSDAEDCALLLASLAEMKNEYTWTTISVLMSLSLGVQGKQERRIELEKRLIERVPIPVNESVEENVPLDSWLISAELMLKCGFMDSALNICDTALCICASRSRNDGFESLFYQLRGGIMLKLYENKHRITDALFCLEKALETSSKVPIGFWSKQCELMVAAIMGSGQTRPEQKAESLFEQFRMKLREEQSQGYIIDTYLAEIAFHEAMFLSAVPSAFNSRIREIIDLLKYVETVWTGEKYGTVVLEHGNIFIKRVSLLNNSIEGLQDQDRKDVIYMVSHLSKAIKILESADSRNAVVANLQLTLALLLANVASSAYREKMQDVANFERLSDVEKRIEEYVKEYKNLDGFALEWKQLELASSQAALNILFSLCSNEDVSKKLRARASLYMANLPSDIGNVEFNPWSDDFWITNDMFANTRKNSVWNPYEINLKAAAYELDDDEDADFSMMRPSIMNSRSVFSTLNVSRLALNKDQTSAFHDAPIIEEERESDLDSEEFDDVPRAMSDPVKIERFMKKTKLSHIWQVESAQYIVNASALCPDDVEVQIEAVQSMLNSIGSSDEQFAFAVLAQLQGAQTSKFCQRLLSQACNAPNASRLAYCIRLLFSQIYGDSDLNGTLWSSIDNFQSWRNSKLFQISPIDKMPFSCLILQHADGFIYAGLFNANTKEVRVVRAKANLADLKSLQDEVQDIRQNLLSDFLKKEYNQKSEEEIASDKPAENSEEKKAEDENKEDEDDEDEEEDEEIEVTDAREKLIKYMKNIMAQLEANLAEIPKEQPFILIADFHLLDTPLELIPELADRPISRDFSLQIFLNRLALREEKEQKTKAAPNTNMTSLSNTVCLATPGRCADSVSQMKQNWKEKSGLSIGEIESFMATSSGLVYCGRERFFSSIPPSRIAALDLSNLNTVFLVDRSPEPTSFIQQNKLDLERDPIVIQAESYINSVALLSLSGVSTVILNQWSSDQESNEWRLKEILNGMNSNTPAVDCLLHIRNPDLKPVKDAKKPVAKKGKNMASPEPEAPEFAPNECQAFNTVLYGLPLTFFSS